MLASGESLAPADWTSFELLQSVIDAFSDPIFAKDLQHRWIACNGAFCGLMGRSYAAIIGHSDPDYFPPEQVTVFWEGDDAVTTTGTPLASEELLTESDGSVHVIWTRKFCVRNTLGHIIGCCGIITDITEIRHKQEEVMRLEAAIQSQVAVIEGQRLLLEEVAVPVIQIWEHILLVPLIGSIDSRRAAQVLESLLESIRRTATQIVIIDITGVPIVDTAVANALISAVRAAQLLGCQSILVGIRPEIAQTLVGLGVDFSRILTRAVLQDGLAYALQKVGRK